MTTICTSSTRKSSTRALPRHTPSFSPNSTTVSSSMASSLRTSRMLLTLLRSHRTSTASASWSVASKTFAAPGAPTRSSTSASSPICATPSLRKPLTPSSESESTAAPSELTSKSLRKPFFRISELRINLHFLCLSHLAGMHTVSHPLFSYFKPISKIYHFL